MTTCAVTVCTVDDLTIPTDTSDPDAPLAVPSMVIDDIGMVHDIVTTEIMGEMSRMTLDATCVSAENESPNPVALNVYVSEDRRKWRSPSHEDPDAITPDESERTQSRSIMDSLPVVTLSVLLPSDMPDSIAEHACSQRLKSTAEMLLPGPHVVSMVRPRPNRSDISCSIFSRRLISR